MSQQSSTLQTGERLLGPDPIFQTPRRGPLALPRILEQTTGITQLKWSLGEGLGVLNMFSSLEWDKG